ncbi:alpha/beta hydrolase [Actinomadura sp. ATCC 31491]|uniref:Alpha/beta hydrolase n=1 Tax=Actinomadura luzonensis TaxID=2805427 RepID=A0ABT0G3D0_9ACTN|nr:alpha/beta hydrolase [Actinomadura luzonensis]MCK2219052.1 alpha/beta hydrolase [Actinomadura luzonensis]
MAAHLVPERTGRPALTDPGAGAPGQGAEGTLVLPGGRVLAYAWRGDPRGTPVLEFPGLPGARRAAVVPAAFLRERGILWVSADRPGLGGSAPQPGRILLDWPHDVRRLADHLGLGRFAVLGGAAGAPYALACAWALADRVSAVALVSGVGPLERPESLAGLGPEPRRLVRLSRRAPGLARLVVAGARAHPLTAFQRLLDALPEPDRRVAARPEVRRSLLESYALAFRQGTAGQVRDWAVLAMPWGFRPGDVEAPVRIFHGALDGLVPLAHAEALAAALPRARLTAFPGEGHLVGFGRAGELLAALAEEARAAAT